MKNKSNIYNNLYLLFFITSPLIYSKKLIDPTLAPRQIHLALFCLVLFFIYFFKENDKPTKLSMNFSISGFILIISTLLLSSIISLFHAKVISEGFFTVSRLSLSIVFFSITTFLLINDKISILNLCKGVLFFALITSIISVYQILSSHEFLIEITGTMANKNLLSSALFLCIPFIIIGLNNNKFITNLSYVVLVLILIIILYLRTRAVVIPTIIGLSLFFYYSLYMLFKNGNKTKSIVILIASLIVLAGLIKYGNDKNILANFSNSNTYQTRVKLWENTNFMIKDYFLFGVGAGNWKTEFANYGIGKFQEEVSNGRMIYTRPHNDFLWFFSETGIIGFFSFCLIFILPIYFLLRLYKNAEDNSNKLKFLVLIITLIGFAFVSYFDFPFERVEHQVLFFTLISIVVFSHNNQMNKDKTKNLNLTLTLSKSKIIVAIVLVVFSLYIGFKRYEGEKNMQQILIAHEEQNWSKLIELVDKTKNSFYLIDPMSVPLDWYKGVSLFAMGDFLNANVTFLEALNNAPFNIHVLNNLASSYEKLGNHELAIKHYKDAIRISPNFEEALLNLSAVYFNIKEFENAYRIIDRCSISSSDPKYKSFLKPILKKKIAIELNKRGLSKLIGNELIREDIEKIYFEAKQNNSIFVDEYLKK
jgi:O-antigen ligase